MSMHVHRGPEPLPSRWRGAALAIGNFDGVHVGHRALLAAARRRAGPGRPAGVVVFAPHPRRFFQPHVPLFEITPLPQKLDLFSRSGVDLAVVLDFDAALAGLSAEAFIADVLVGRLDIAAAVVGYDFHFGKGRAGNPALLAEAGRVAGFAVDVLEPVAAGSMVASSSAVRARLQAGDVAGAADMLGHWWRIEGAVVGGAKRGTGLGYPTANMAVSAGTALAHGIYAVRVYVGDDVHPGAAYLGSRPTFDDGQPVLETFLLDFDGDLYGRTVAVEFIARLREDRAFASADALRAQMDHDVAATRRALAEVDAADPYRWPERRPAPYHQP
jgi:riboflavin kinase/FMN adenylyltransferase